MGGRAGIPIPRPIARDALLNQAARWRGTEVCTNGEAVSCEMWGIWGSIYLQGIAIFHPMRRLRWVGRSWHGRGYLRGTMNTANASGFFGLGLVMWLLPLLAPGWFPHVAVDGSSTRALWIQAMGMVQCCIGAGYLFHFANLAIRTWLESLAIQLAQRRAVWAAEREAWANGVVRVDFRDASSSMREAA